MNRYFVDLKSKMKIKSANKNYYGNNQYHNERTDDLRIYIVYEKGKHGIANRKRANVIVPFEYDDIFCCFRFNSLDDGQHILLFKLIMKNKAGLCKITLDTNSKKITQEIILDLCFDSIDMNFPFVEIFKRDRTLYTKILDENEYRFFEEPICVCRHFPETVEVFAFAIRNDVGCRYYHLNTGVISDYYDSIGFIEDMPGYFLAFDGKSHFIINQLTDETTIYKCGSLS